MPPKPPHVCLHLVVGVVPFGPLCIGEHISKERKTYLGLKMHLCLEPLLSLLLLQLPAVVAIAIVVAGIVEPMVVVVDVVIDTLLIVDDTHWLDVMFT